MSTERIEGPTPAGGAYSIAFFCDAETRRARPKEEATAAIVSEYDEDGALLAETFLVHEPEPA